MGAGRSSKNNIVAGLFVVCAAVLFVVVIVVMSNLGDFFTKQSTYTVRFSIFDGVEGLDEGAAVKIGGQRVGKVKSIAPHYVSGKPEAIDVVVQIPATIRLTTEFEVQLLKPLLGTGSSINVAMPTPVEGETPAPGTPIAPGGMIVGHAGPPGFLAPADYAKLSSLLKQGDEIVRESRPAIKNMVADAEATVKNARAISEDLGKKWPVWSQQASDVMARVESASKEFDKIVETVKGLTTSVQDGVKKAEGFIDRAQKLVEENGPRIDEIIKSARNVAEKADKVWSEKITGIMDEASGALKTADATIRDGRDILTRNSSQIDDVVTNISLATQQLKLAMVEIRASPWRLTYQPGKKELENELLYNSVRQYSDAVGELKSAAESLKAVTQRTGEGGQGAKVDQGQVDAMAARLKRAFEEYQKTERAFLDRWAGEKK